MCWVALTVAKLAGIRGMPELETEWRQTAGDEIRADILEHGVRHDGVLRQHYDTDALDASTLLAAVRGSSRPTTRGCGAACWPSPRT